MPDQRSVMKEFRSLDQKRVSSGLTPAEEARYAHLRDLVGGEAESRPGFDVDAAAAQLRDSLLPAGLRNRPPPPAPPAPAPEPEAEVFAEELSPAEALQPAYGEEVPPTYEAVAQPDAFFDSGALPPDGSEASTGAEAPAEQAAWDPNAPYDAGAAAYDPNAAAYDPNAPGYDPNAVAYDPNAPGYDPNALAYDPNAPGYDPNAAAYDPNAPGYDPNAAAYDPNAPGYDPNAAAYDPNAPGYDPNAAAYDPNAPQGWDPNAQATWDPNAPQEPGAQGWEPGAQPYEASAEPYTAEQPLDLNAPAAYDADAQLDPNVPYDPNASPEAGVQGFPAPDAAALVPEGEPLASLDATAEFAPDGGLPPEGWYAEGSGAQAQGLGEAPASIDEAGLESLLPFDPAAEASIVPGELPEGFGRVLGEYDDTAGFAARHGDPSPADLPQEGADFQAARSVVSEGTEGWPAEVQLEEGFQLASGGSFDATAEAAAPEWAGGTSPPPWEATPAEAEPPADLLVAPEASFSTGETTEGAGAPPELSLEPQGGEGELAPVQPEYVEPLAPVAEVGAAGAPEAGAEAFGELEPPTPEQAAALAPEPPEAGADDFALDIEEELPPDLAEQAPALDFSRPDFSADQPPGEDAFAATPAAPAAAEPSFDLPAEPAPAVPALDFGSTEDLSPEEPVTTAAAAGAVFEEEEIPTIEGEEILEEIVEDVPPSSVDLVTAPPGPAEPELAPAAAVLVPEPPPAPTAVTPEPPAPPVAPPAAVAPPPPAAPVIAPPIAPAAVAPPPAPAVIAPPPPAAAAVPEPAASELAWVVPGSHRVVVHTVEGQVKRGVVEDVDLAGSSLGLVPQAGASPEAVPSEKVKAIFFMLSPGEKAPAPEGRKVRVTFRDGRQIAGFSPDYRDEGVGFFMIPGDTRTNTGRIWVYRAAVKQVAVS